MLRPWKKFKETSNDKEIEYQDFFPNNPSQLSLEMTVLEKETSAFQKSIPTWKKKSVTAMSRQLALPKAKENLFASPMKKKDTIYLIERELDLPFDNVLDILQYYLITFNNTENIKNTLGEVLEKNNKKQLRISETEKYPHVTFFFSGGREKPFDGEKRILKDSPKVATYDLKPEMSAFLVTEALIKEIKGQFHDFICLNFANGDMVGHTGIMSAAIKACEAIDKCVKEIVNTAINSDYSILLIADHGNCETMSNPDGSPNTAHTNNLVPVILIDNDLKSINSGILANIAPTILELMGIEIPNDMTQDSLLK